MDCKRIIDRIPKSPFLQRAYAKDCEERLIWRGPVRKSKIACQIDLREAPIGLKTYAIAHILRNKEHFFDDCFDLVTE